MRWSFEALGQITNLDTQFRADISRIGPGLAMQYGDRFRRNPVQNWLILLVFIVEPIILTCLVLKRKTTTS